MSTNWSQAETVFKIDHKFVNQAVTLRPDLIHTDVFPKEMWKNASEISNHFIGEYPLHRDDSILLDFGKHFVGYIQLSFNTVRGIYDAPALIRLKFYEQTDEMKSDSSCYNGWIGKGWLQEELIHIDDFPVTLKLPRRYAFRYLKIEILDTSENYDICLQSAILDSVSAVSMNNIAESATEDPMLNRIDSTCISTLKDCMQEVFEDGPKRDRRLWIGDLYLQAKVNHVTFRKYSLVKRCLYLFAGLLREDGAVASCVYAEPRLIADNIFLLDYSLFFVSTLLDYYENTEDVDTLKDLYPTALRQLELPEVAVQEDNLIGESGYNCFIDWNDTLNRQTAMNGVYLFALQQGIKLATYMNDVESKTRLISQYNMMRESVRTKLFDSEIGLFVSGKERQISYASQIWMVLGNAVEKDEAVEILLKVSEHKEAIRIMTPFLYHFYIEALLKCSLKEIARKEIYKYWGGMIERGADTFWEIFNPQNPLESPYGSAMINSYCHAWSCTPSCFIRNGCI